MYPKFLERFVAAARKLKVGDPLDPTTEQGAVISRSHFDKIMGYLRLARETGGQIHCGGEPAPPPNDRCKYGVFVQPRATPLPPLTLSETPPAEATPARVEAAPATAPGQQPAVW